MNSFEDFGLAMCIKRPNNILTNGESSTAVGIVQPEFALVGTVAHQGAMDGLYHTWSTSAPITGAISGASGTPFLTTGDSSEMLAAGAQNDDFNDIGDSFIDFTESNPFGDPS